MKQRKYQGQNDLFEIGAMIRKIFEIDPYWNSWSFALYDIWSQRKIGDREVFGLTDWEDDIQLWEDQSAGLVGAAAFRDPAFVKLVVYPEYRDWMASMLDWVESRYLEKGLQDQQLTIESIESNPYFEEILVQRGYKKESGHYIFREKTLTDSPLEPIIIPPGFQVKHIETEDDLKRFHRGTERVFNFPDNPDVYQILRQAPSFVPELDLIILSPDERIASFGSVWFDRHLGLAEFEPVGTVPEFRKLGLGSAILAEACNRLRTLGCQTISVMSWSDSPGANRLYEKAGFLPKVKKNDWKKMLKLQT